MIVFPKQNTVQHNFSKAAPHYDTWAVPQKAVAARLGSMPPASFKAEAILELGCGTGCLTRLLYQRFHPRLLTAIDSARGMIDACRKQCTFQSETEFLHTTAETYRSGRVFDLAASSFSFQWFTDKKTVLENTRRHLAEKGLLALAVPMPGSLRELAESYREALGASIPALDLPDAAAYVKLCEKAGFSPISFEHAVMPFFYESARSALKALHHTGTALHNHDGVKPLSFAQLRKVLEVYDGRFSNSEGAVSLSYEVLFLLLEKQS